MNYQTEQKSTLLRFFQENEEKQFAMHEIITESRRYGEIGESSIYRIVKSLVEDGRVRRFSPGNKREVYYQYINNQTCQHHLHLKCTVCGAMHHLNSTVSEFIWKQIQATNQFDLDETSTILFGTCKKCRGESYAK